MGAEGVHGTGLAVGTEEDGDGEAVPGAGSPVGGRAVGEEMKRKRVRSRRSFRSGEARQLMDERASRRFWEKVDRSAGSGCWHWLAEQVRGYGYFYIGAGSDGKLIRGYAHRVVWELVYGAIPEDAEVCHRCDDPLCVNPRHLFLGTQKDNVRDMVEKGRGRWNWAPGWVEIERHPECRRRGEDHPGAKLTEDAVREIRREIARGVRQCEVAKRFGVNSGTISAIVCGKIWRHLEV